MRWWDLDLSPPSLFSLPPEDPACRPGPWETSGALRRPHPHVLTPRKALPANSLHPIAASPPDPAPVLVSPRLFWTYNCPALTTLILASSPRLSSDTARGMALRCTPDLESLALKPLRLPSPQDDSFCSVMASPLLPRHPVISQTLPVCPPMRA